MGRSLSLEAGPALVFLLKQIVASGGPAILLVSLVQSRSKTMMDVLMVLGTALFFAVSIGYTYGCEHLRL